MVKEKYSVGEYERRFLLREIPPGAGQQRRIVDHYIDGTRLRLRAVDEPGVETDRKLGHKRRVDDTDPTAIMHTTMYIDADEYDILAALPSRRLVKDRWAIDVDGRQCSVNVFGESLSGLIILEADLGAAEQLDSFVAPPWAGPEVSTDEAFTGGLLAGASFTQLEPYVARLFRSVDITDGERGEGRN